MLYILTLLAAVLVGGSVEEASCKMRSNMYIYVEDKQSVLKTMREFSSLPRWLADSFL